MVDRDALRVVAASFEACRASLDSSAGGMRGIADRLDAVARTMSDRDVGGDHGGALSSHIDVLGKAVHTVGGTGLPGVAARLQEVLERFQQIDHADAANPVLGPQERRPGRSAR